ncbi:hypothetical protein DFJ43DRAFT_1155077 [Lentinula guzmanii]|uniref:Uncharacterized protein n=1 Tax=Lentinula guzmanii TaxID=2804957 RepID=A0AA38JG61_9AGAR|nr:hypothetical protein DFJ43DRAFT_1155077 [Lentinula guzmanii]
MDMLTFPLLGTQTIRQHLQLHYSEHDPCLVAQPFDIRTAYLAMIHYPHSSDSTTTILWALLDESKFEPIVDQKLADDPLGSQIIMSSNWINTIRPFVPPTPSWPIHRYLLAKLGCPIFTMHLVHFD